MTPVHRYAIVASFWLITSCATSIEVVRVTPLAVSTLGDELATLQQPPSASETDKERRLRELGAAVPLVVFEIRNFGSRTVWYYGQQGQPLPWYEQRDGNAWKSPALSCRQYYRDVELTPGESHRFFAFVPISPQPHRVGVEVKTRSWTRYQSVYSPGLIRSETVFELAEKPPTEPSILSLRTPTPP